MKAVIIAYVPVIHKGYLNFFDKHSGAQILYLIGKKITQKFPYLKKDIRALEVKEVKQALLSLGLSLDVKELNQPEIYQLAENKTPLIAAREEVTANMINKYFPNNPVTWDDVFLMWDKHKSKASQIISPDVEISEIVFDKKMACLLKKETQKSSCWWRRVGAAIVKNKKVLLIGHNKHLPSQHQPYFDGDPRNNFHKGDKIELSTSFHAEATLIAQAAKNGISLDGCEMYVSTFPCPPCAKLIAHSGINKLYFSQGYGVLDGEKVLKAEGVEIVRVK